MKLLRVFPRRTPLTPTDDLAFVGDPPLWRPKADKVHVSCCFTWDKPEAERLADSWSRFYPVDIGGPAYKTPAKDFTPGLYLKEGVTITSRGCPRKCPWCVVPEIEGKTKELPILPGNIVQDNNLLACSMEHVERVFYMLAGQRRISFPGGLDARLLQPWHVSMLKFLRVFELWFAADADYWAALRRASLLLHEFKRNKKRCYVLIGYNGEDIGAAEERLEMVWGLGFLPFAQFYRGPGEQKKTKEWATLVRQWTRPAIMKARMNETTGGK